MHVFRAAGSKIRRYSCNDELLLEVERHLGEVVLSLIMDIVVR